MAEESNNKEEQVRWLPLFNQWRNFTLEMFAKKAHIFYASEDGTEKSMDEVVDNLFNDNKEIIFGYMSNEEKKDFGYWVATGKGQWPTDEDRAKDDYEKKASEKYPKSADDLDKGMILPYPCVLRINSHCITSELMISQTNFQRMEDDFYAFSDESLQEIIEDTILSKKDLQRREPGITVFCWSKSQNTKRTNGTGLYQLSGGGRESVVGDEYVIDSRLDTSWIDLSDFIISVNTNVGNDAGSFSFTLPVYTSKQLKTKRGIDWMSVNSISTELGILTDEKQEQHLYIKEEFNEHDVFNIFNQLISENDLVFISFSKLDKNDARFEIQSMFDSENISSLAAKSSFDMIGLVDTVSINKNAEGSIINVEISGRDLNKLLVEDGSFFYNPSTTVAPSEVFFNEQGYEKQGDIRDVDEKGGKYQAINRLRRTKGELDIFCNQTNLNIDYIIKGVVSQLANIEIVPSDVFAKWENRTRWKVIHPDEELKEQQKGNATGNASSNKTDAPANTGGNANTGSITIQRDIEGQL